MSGVLSEERFSKLCALLGATDSNDHDDFAEANRCEIDALKDVVEGYAFEVADDGPRVKELADGAAEAEELAAVLADAIAKFSDRLEAVGKGWRHESAICEYMEEQSAILERPSLVVGAHGEGPRGNRQ